MKQRQRKWLSLLLILALLLSPGMACLSPAGGEAAAAGEEGFQDLSQNQIVEAMGAGWNLGNQLEANDGEGTPKEDAWTGVTVTERMIRTVQRKGFGTIRIPVSYLSMIGEGPDYTIDSAWLDRVQQVVDWAVQYNLYVVMNIHGDGYSSVKGGWILPGAEDQDTIRAKFEAVWKQIAERFKDYDQHLIFESMNEIGANIAEKYNVKEEEIRAAYENINAYNQIFVDTVRQTGGNNDRRWLLVPGLNTNVNYTVGDYGFAIPEDSHLSTDIPAGQKRIMISVHYYDPWAFCGQEDYATTQWGEDAASSKTVGYGQEDDMKDQFTSLKERFTSQGYPVVIGEYGAIDKSTKKDSGVKKNGEADPENNTFRAYYAWMLCTLSVQNGCVPIYWDNGWNGDFGFGLFDRSSYKETQPAIIQSILSCYEDKENGASSVTMNRKILEMEQSDNGVQLEAALTPDTGETIQWSSSDESVAKVGYRGMVKPAGKGVCLITASVAGGASTYCVVRVREPQNFRAGLFAQTAEGWVTLECDNYLEIAENGGGGDFTLSLSGTKEQMSKLTTLYIKDVAAQRGVSETSRLESGKFTVSSLKFNGNDATMKKTVEEYYEGDEYIKDQPTGKKTVPDICMVNYWYEQGNWISDLTKNSADNTGSSFPEEWYVEGTNTITIQINVADAVLKEQKQTAEKDIEGITLSEDRLGITPGETKELSAAATPADATEPVLWFSENQKTASVDQSGKVTGITEGETVIHALTASGKDVACAVRVGDGSLPDVAPSPSADTSQSSGTDASPAPSASTAPAPGTDVGVSPSPSADAGTGVGSSASPSPVPGSSSDPGTGAGTDASPAPGKTPSPGSEGDGSQGKDTLVKGSVFQAGKLLYRISSTSKKTVAVKGAASKKITAAGIPASVKKKGISYKVTAIDAAAFQGCKKLKKVTVGKNVASIGKNCFQNAARLKKITIKGTMLKKVGKNALKGIHKKATVKVPKKKLKKYRKLFSKKGQKKTVKIKG